LKFNREKDTHNPDALLIWVQVAIALGLALMETAWLPCAIIGATQSQHSIPPTSAASQNHHQQRVNESSTYSTQFTKNQYKMQKVNSKRQQRVKTMILLPQSGSISQKQVRGCLIWVTI
jgi:hypothetical protein